jgi:hypothetical protein
VKKNILLFLSFIFILLESHGQNYQQAAGIRLGSTSGFTYRKMITREFAGEVMLLNQNGGSALTLLFEKQKPALLFDDLNVDFIYGLGAHIGYASGRDDDDDDDFGDENDDSHWSRPQLGFDAYASFEYPLKRYPVTVSLDCKPYFDFFDDNFLGLHLPVISIGARYTF